MPDPTPTQPPAVGQEFGDFDRDWISQEAFDVAIDHLPYGSGIKATAKFFCENQAATIAAQKVEIDLLRADLDWALKQTPVRMATVRQCEDCKRPTSKVRPSLRCQCGPAAEAGR